MSPQLHLTQLISHKLISHNSSYNLISHNSTPTISSHHNLISHVTTTSSHTTHLPQTHLTRLIPQSHLTQLISHKFISHNMIIPHTRNCFLIATVAFIQLTSHILISHISGFPVASATLSGHGAALRGRRSVSVHLDVACTAAATLSAGSGTPLGCGCFSRGRRFLAFSRGKRSSFFHPSAPNNSQNPNAPSAPSAVWWTSWSLLYTLATSMTQAGAPRLELWHLSSYQAFGSPSEAVQRVMNHSGVLSAAA